MKIYGRAENHEAELENLVETMLVADPEVLRELASFLYRCADAIEDQPDWENDHFESNEVVSPGFAVFNPNLVEG